MSPQKVNKLLNLLDCNRIQIQSLGINKEIIFFQPEKDLKKELSYISKPFKADLICISHKSPIAIQINSFEDGIIILEKYSLYIIEDIILVMERK